VIKSFANQQTAEIWGTGKTKGSPPANITKRKLAMLDAAVEVSDLKYLPGNRLEKLRGDRQGNTASASTTSIEFASSGVITTLTTWK